MKNLLTFGSFIQYKRKGFGYRQKDVAEKLGICCEYVGELESGRKANPNEEILQGLIRVLNLDDDDIATFYDLHAEANGMVSKDIADYIMEKGVIRKAIRASKKNDAPDGFWSDIADMLGKIRKSENKDQK